MRDLVALRRFLEERAAVPFAWGRDANDCGAFVLDAVAAQTGRDPMRSRWTTMRGAARLIRKAGGMEALVNSLFRPIPVARAMRGDIAGLPDGAFGILLMIVADSEQLVGPGDTRAPRSAMIRAWSVEA